MKRCLVLTKKAPFPTIDGETMVIMSDIKALKALGYEIDVLSLNTKKHYADYSIFPSEINSLAKFYKIDIDTSISILGAINNLFTEKSYIVERFYSKEFELELISILETKYDFVILEGLTMMLYFKTIKSIQTTQIYLRAHNVEYQIWQRLTDSCTNFLKKKYFEFSTSRIKKYEIDSFKIIDGCIAISTIDEDEIKKHCTKKTTSIAMGFETKTKLYNIDENKGLFFIGSFDWLPNVEGLKWFIDKIFPKILKEKPNTILHIAGRNFNKNILNPHQNILIIGEVSDAEKFIIENNIMIVPLLSGSGIRIKIIEGMMMGKPIVSTSIGAEGIGAKDNVDIMIADDEIAFAKKVLELLDNEVLKKAIEENALKFAKFNYSNVEIKKKFEEFF